MTDEQKTKRNTFLNVAYKLFNTIGIFGILLTIGAAKEEIKTLSFDNIQDKVNTKNHVNNTLSELDLYNLTEHIGNPDFHMSRKVKDSLYVLRVEYNDLLDRIAITNYQTKEQLRELTELIRAIKKLLD
ncbi:MAG: hypothetical protein KDD03_02290 [Gelidibacter sp.]|nr:hypothetical protein [Gelidibacter sp.]